MSPELPTHRMIEAFRATILHGGISAAADALGMSQPSTSRLLADFQKIVGYDLFIKHGRTVRPTEEALALMTKVQQSFLGIEEIARFSEQLRKRRMGRLSICTNPAVGHSIMPPAIEHLRRKYPNVVVSLNITSFTDVVRRVRNRQADIGIAPQGPPMDEVETVATFSADCVCIGSPRWPLAKARFAELADLAGKPFVALTSELQRRLEVQLAAAGLDLDIVAETSLSQSASELVLRGLGISVVDAFTGIMHRQRGGSVLPLQPSLGYTVQAMALGDARLSEPARELLRYLDSTTRSEDMHADAE